MVLKARYWTPIVVRLVNWLCVAGRVNSPLSKSGFVTISLHITYYFYILQFSFASVDKFTRLCVVCVFPHLILNSLHCWVVRFCCFFTSLDYREMIFVQLFWYNFYTTFSLILTFCFYSLSSFFSLFYF